MVKYNIQFLLYLIVIRCSARKPWPNKIEEEACFIYQTYPVAHAGLKMDYVNSILASNVAMGCQNFFFS